MGVRGVVSMVTLLVATAPLAQAQGEPLPLTLPPGVRVRLWTLSLPGPSIEGALQSADSTSITLVPRGSPPLTSAGLSVPTRSVTRLEVALEKKRHWWEGALIGAAVGAAIVGLGSDVDPVLCEVNQDVICSRAEAFGIGALGGSLFGLAIGALIQTDQYTPVAVDSLGSASPKRVGAGRPRPSLQVTLRF
jgi:hypothetical protein